jgi:hypothetical protein
MVMTEQEIPIIIDTHAFPATFLHDFMFTSKSNMGKANGIIAVDKISGISLLYSLIKNCPNIMPTR